MVVIWIVTNNWAVIDCKYTIILILALLTPCSLGNLQRHCVALFHARSKLENCVDFIGPVLRLRRLLGVFFALDIQRERHVSKTD
jgi:hypothetical protein